MSAGGGPATRAGIDSAEERGNDCIFRKILVPVDLSDRHDRALAIAAELAASSGGEVTLLHVVQEIHGLPREAEPGLYGKLEALSRRHLDRLLDRLRGRAVEVRCVIRVGEPGPEVLRYAREEHAELLVLASHSVDPVVPGGEWASLSHLLGIVAPCPVLLVK